MTSITAVPTLSLKEDSFKPVWCIPSRNGHAPYPKKDCPRPVPLKAPSGKPISISVSSSDREKPSGPLPGSNKSYLLGESSYSRPYLRFSPVKPFAESTHELDRAVHGNLLMKATEQVTNAYNRTTAAKTRRMPMSLDPYRSTEESRSLAKRYSEGAEKVGQGSYGKVFLVKDSETGFTVALKINRSGRLKNALQELVLTAKVQGISHTLPLLNFFQLNECKYALVFKAYTMTLEKALCTQVSQKIHYSLDEIADFFAKALEHFSALHRRGLMHCDVKPNNIHYSASDKVLYLCDFGKVSSPFSDNMWKRINAPSFQAPEVTLESSYSFSAEIFTLGCVFYEIITQKPLFKTPSTKPITDTLNRTLTEYDAQCARHLREIFEILGPIPLSVIQKSSFNHLFFSKNKDVEEFEFAFKTHQQRPLSKLGEECCALRKDNPSQFQLAWDIVTRMLQTDPRKRPTAEELRNHPFVRHLKTPEPKVAHTPMLCLESPPPLKESPLESKKSSPSPAQASGAKKKDPITPTLMGKPPIVSVYHGLNVVKPIAKRAPPFFNPNSWR